MNPRIDGHQAKPTKYSDLYSSDNDIRQNEIEERIQVSEPFKSIFQSGARFMLAQTTLPNHVSIDTAMDYINHVAYMLSKPSTLIKSVGMAAVTIVGLLLATFLSPGFYKFLEAAWSDPINALNLDRYLSNGLSERSVLDVIGSTTDEALSRVGLQDGSCRERSICYMGEMMKCTFPGVSDYLTKVASENFSSSRFHDNKYFKAFTSGFVNRNCTNVAWSSEQGENKSCLGNFMSSVLNPRIYSSNSYGQENGKSQKTFQKLSVSKSQN